MITRFRNKLCMFHKHNILFGKFRNLYLSHRRCTLQCLSYEDGRLQKHIKFLKDQFLKNPQNQIFNNLVYTSKSLNNMISTLEDIEAAEKEMKELESFISELEDGELLAIATQDKENLENKISFLKSYVLQFIIPDELIDDKDIIMELSPGVGGQEAMLFTKNMFDMYRNFVCWKGWSSELLKYDDTDLGGLRCAHMAISGRNAFKILKYECGVHRIQRVPKTEKAGRIHTSTMTVAILPQPTEIDIVINPQDIELEFKRSRGAGGQHVNTTDSCVRILHKPSGIVTESQMERNQHKNRELAMKMLRAKLYEIELEKIVKDTTLKRKLQIGTAARSEKVRTYNFAQDRITDHRAQINLFGIDLFFHGEEHLSKLLEQLQEWNSLQSLMEILDEYK